MAYDHEEQEQLDAIKSWWKQYGNIVTWFLIAVMSVVLLWKGWGTYQVKMSGQASALYEEIQKAIQEKDQAKVLRAVTDVEEKYASTNYAPMAALLVAKYAFEANDLKTAKSQLTWVVDHGKSDEFKSLAKIRLSSILLDEKSFDDALKLLAGNFPAELASTVSDRRGDILVAQNKLDDARQAYQLAIDKGSDKNPDRQLIQMKLDALGGAPAKSTIAKIENK